MPGGVVNILTGKTEEIIDHAAVHMDVNAIVYQGDQQDDIQLLEEKAISNVKRIRTYSENWMDEAAQSLYHVTDLQEIKTTWHPIEKIGGSAPGY